VAYFLSYAIPSGVTTLVTEAEGCGFTALGVIASEKTILWGLHLENSQKSVTLSRLLFQYPDGYLGLFLRELLP